MKRNVKLKFKSRPRHNGNDFNTFRGGDNEVIKNQKKLKEKLYLVLNLSRSLLTYNIEYLTLKYKFVEDTRMILVLFFLKNRILEKTITVITQRKDIWAYLKNCWKGPRH